MRTHVDLSTGRLEYEDSGSGTPNVLLHGAFMNASLWDGVVDRLRADHRCIVPVMPLGGHRRTMPATAAVTPSGVAAMVAELLARLDLDNVTLAGVDTGGAIAQLLMTQPVGAERVARLCLIACDAFDNFPPGVPGKASVLAARTPGGLASAALAMRTTRLARLPITFGWLTKRPIERRVMDDWFTPLRDDAGVRRDLRRFLLSVDKTELAEAGERLVDVSVPSLVVWSREDKVMPPAHAERLAALLPDSRLVWVDDSYTLVPLDQPAKLAGHLRELVTVGRS